MLGRKERKKEGRNDLSAVKDILLSDTRNQYYYPSFLHMYIYIYGILL